MKDGLRFVDSDMHIMEPPDLFDRYLDAAFKHRISVPVGADGRVRFGHPSGTLKVGAQVKKEGNRWKVRKVLMSRSARRLMEGWVRVPAA